MRSTLFTLHSTALNKQPFYTLDFLLPYQCSWLFVVYRCETLACLNLGMCAKNRMGGSVFIIPTFFSAYFLDGISKGAV